MNLIDFLSIIIQTDDYAISSSPIYDVCWLSVVPLFAHRRCFQNVKLWELAAKLQDEREEK